MKLPAALGIGAPRRPRREEVVAQAEARLEDLEALAAAPAHRQRIAGEKDAPGLLERALVRVIDVAVFGRVRRAVGVALEARGNDRSRLHGAAVGSGRSQLRGSR